VEIFRRTEWHGGDSRFIGFEFNEEGRLLVPDIKNRTIEFIGDSYLCGYGNEATIMDNEFTYATENAYMSYGAISSRELDAEYVSVCYSGIGVERGNKDTTFTIANYYDKVTNESSIPWDYSHYHPSLVVIGLGSNDIIGNADSTSFTNAYVDFLKRIRSKYSTTPIVCLAGPSSLKSNWQKLRNYISGSVNKFAETDDQVYYFQFTPVMFDGLLDHPAVIEDQQLANELVPFLRQLMK
jgi:lysophospholipase L1-like esterase